MNRRARRTRLPARNSPNRYPFPIGDAQDLLDEAVRNPINAHRMLSLVDLQFGKTPVPDGFDPWTHTPAVHVIDACMRGIARIISESPSFRTDQQLRKRVTTFWPRLIPWSMYFLDSIILEHADIMVSNHELSKYIDSAACNCVRFLLRALELDEIKKSLAQVAPHLLSSLTKAWIVTVENGIQVASLLTQAAKKWMDSEDHDTFGDVTHTFIAFPKSRLMGCLTRIISCVQDRQTPVPWMLLTYNLMFIQFIGEGRDLRLEYLLMKSIPWVCRLITYSRHHLDKHPEEMHFATKPLILSFGYLAGVLVDGPEWITQALDNRLLVSLAWFTGRSHTFHYPRELDQAICSLLHLFTVNTVWRSVLRPMFRSMRHADLSFLEHRSEVSNEILEQWDNLEEAFEERWKERCSYKDEVGDYCMNTLHCPGIEIDLFRCPACSGNFCSRSCQKDPKDTTHQTICKTQRNRKKRGYPEIAVARDCEFLCWVVQQYLFDEEKYIDDILEEYLEEHKDESVGVVSVDFTRFPPEVTVGSFDDYKSRAGDREEEWRAELEKAKQRIPVRTGTEGGKLVLTSILHGKEPLYHFQWLEDFSDLEIDVFTIFTLLS
ncbi:uncharacterized protein EV420DRAFT_256145 [Desarmillaria tabescens]|uniref:MYND-type domain-containing protein n=1 Tax=Armillaria tabescens TaxID=1929756 RepID=A0AA39KJ00_ARMTA|nr:uncharacterized protein EV420DRAFT_256145 [Desarmillaria tabescens]KAK0460243.1 hypothetical protein EV420DRAFT_256145 [Desarmillaria tabescens]